MFVGYFDCLVFKVIWGHLVHLSLLGPAMACNSTAGGRAIRSEIWNFGRGRKGLVVTCITFLCSRSFWDDLVYLSQNHGL